MTALKAFTLASAGLLIFSLVDHYRTGRKLESTLSNLEDDLGELRSDYELALIASRTEAGHEAVYRLGYSRGIAEAKELAARGCLV